MTDYTQLANEAEGRAAAFREKYHVDLRDVSTLADALLACQKERDHYREQDEADRVRAENAEREREDLAGKLTGVQNDGPEKRALFRLAKAEAERDRLAAEVARLKASCKVIVGEGCTGIVGHDTRYFRDNERSRAALKALVELLEASDGKQS